MTNKKIQVVIVGGGASGLELARRLGSKYGRKRHDIILVEKSRTHIWKPLLHEVAAGSLDANLDEVGYRSHGHAWGYRFFYGTVDTVDPVAGYIQIAPVMDEDGSELIARHPIRFDYLVLAMGSVSNDFNTPGAQQNCLFLDSRAQADRFRDKLLNHCLRVSRTMIRDASADSHVRIVIVGAGATGVELAAELYNSASALRHYGLEVFDESRLKVTLVEAGPRILPALPEKLSAAAQHELENLGVRVLTGMAVTEVTPTAVITRSGENIPADVRVWAAGVKGVNLAHDNGGLEMTRGGQFVVRSTLQTTRFDNIFAMGDCCSCTLPGHTQPVPPRAQAAHQMAGTVFDNLNSVMTRRDLKSFVYRDHGSLVSLSRFSTVGSLMGRLIGGRMAIEGRLARLVYISLYRQHLIAIHGWFKGIALIVIGRVNAIVRPKLKLH